jgi:hypothetical protein
VAGIKLIGEFILDSLLYPIQKFLELMSSLPGVGKYAAAAAESIQGIRNSISVEAPNKSSSQTKQIDLRGEINFNNVPAGTTGSFTTMGAPAIGMNLIGANK